MPLLFAIPSHPKPETASQAFMESFIFPRAVCGGLLDKDLVLRGCKTEWGNRVAMPPTVTCLVAVCAVLVAGTREGGKAMC